SVAASARDAFETVSTVLGTAIGETGGYLLTGVWTVLVVVALGRGYAGRWFASLGVASATLILAGVLSPLELPVIDTANFVGYVLWSVWLISFGVLILARQRRSAAARSAAALIMPATLSLLISTFADARERALAVGLWAAPAGLGVALGPVLGGVLLERFWWGSIFVVNVPLTAIALVAGVTLVGESRDPV